jgi:hypothetical protein
MKPEQQSTPFLKYYNASRASSTMPISNESSKTSNQEDHQQIREKLSSTRHPMTFYVRLKSSGELTREAIHALLFNPHLNSLDDIHKIASETQIPACYVIAKLLKLNTPLVDIAPWYKKVPSITALKAYIHEHDSRYAKHTRNPESLDDWRRSLQQVQMDITAHLSYHLLKSEIRSAYNIWRGFCIQKGIAHTTKVAMTKVPSLWLLEQALKSHDEAKAQIVLAVWEWDENVIAVPQKTTRRRLIMDIIKTLSSQTLEDPKYPAIAVTVLRLNREILDADDLATCIRLIKQSSQGCDTGQQTRNTIAFLERVIERVSDVRLPDQSRFGCRVTASPG